MIRSNECLGFQIFRLFFQLRLALNKLAFACRDRHSGPVIFFAWFVFLNGEPFWLTGATGFTYGVDEVMIPTQRLSGLEFVMPGSETAIREDIGTLSLKVHGCNDIHVAYDFIDLGSDELDFQRLAGVQGRACDG